MANDKNKRDKIHTGTFDGPREALEDIIAGPPETRQVNATVSGQGSLEAPEEHRTDEGSLDESYAARYKEEALQHPAPDDDIAGGGAPNGGFFGSASLSLEDATQGNVVEEGTGGSGGTGGDMTGERTPGGMSEDLTQGRAGGGFYGGPTGGTYTGHGVDTEGKTARAGNKTRPDLSEAEIDAELARKVAAKNTRQLQDHRP